MSSTMQSSLQQTPTEAKVQEATAPVVLNTAAQLRPSGYLESELESVSTSSESTSTSESDPGKVISDFDAAVTTSMDYAWMNTPRGYARGGRSIKSLQPSYVPSPLNRAHKRPESFQSTEQPTPSREATTVSPANGSTPREGREVPDEHSLTVTPRESQELVPLPPIEPDRIKKLVEAIASAINWARTLTENDDNYKGEHDAVLAILYILTVRLNEGCLNRHVPLYRSLLKTIKTLTKWCQEVVSHRADWDWPLVSVTLRGYIQKLKDFQVSLAIDSDPNTIAARLNAQIVAHNNSRAEAEAIRQAQKQKEREDKMARRAARAEIRRMHTQFVAMRRAQMEGVELTELLGDIPRDEESQSPPLIPDGSMGSHSVHSEGHYASNLQQVLAPLSSPGSKPSMSSLGSIIPPNRPSPRATEQSTPSRQPTSGTQSPHSPRASALVVPPGSRRESTSPRPDVPPSSHTRPTDPYSKPLPHRPFSVTNSQLSVPIKPPSHGGPPSPLIHPIVEDVEVPPRSKARGVASSGRTHIPRVPVPPINMTPSASSRRSASVTSDPPLLASKELPPAYQSSSIFGTDIDAKRKNAEVEKSEKLPLDSDDDLVAALNRVTNHPVHVTAASEAPEYPDLTRSGSPPSSGKPYAPPTTNNQVPRKRSGRREQNLADPERVRENLRREVDELSGDPEETAQSNHGADVLIRMYEPLHSPGIMQVMHRDRSHSEPQATATRRASSAKDHASIKSVEKARSMRGASGAESKSLHAPTRV